MKLTPIKTTGPLFMADLQQLKDQLQRLGKKQSLVLAGELLLCSLEPLTPQQGFLTQSARRATAGRFGARTGGPELKLALDRAVLAEVQRLKAKPVFAVDCLLRYGLKLSAREEHVVIAGFPTTLRTSVMGLVFRKGALVEVLEFEASHPSAHTHDADLHAMLERLRLSHPSAQVHWCGPLDAPPGLDARPVPDSIWSLGPAQVLTTSTSATLIGRHGLPVAIVMLAGAGYIGALALPYEQYRVSAAHIEAESSHLQGQYAFASDRLASLAARETFFTKQAAQAAQLQRIESVLAALAKSPVKVVVKDARIRIAQSAAQPSAQPGAAAEHDFELTVELERDGEQNAIAQSEPLLTLLATELGADVRLAPVNGHKDQPATSPSERGLRVYNIQGDFRRAS